MLNIIIFGAWYFNQDRFFELEKYLYCVHFIFLVPSIWVVSKVTVIIVRKMNINKLNELLDRPIWMSKFGKVAKFSIFVIISFAIVYFYNRSHDFIMSGEKFIFLWGTPFYFCAKFLGVLEFLMFCAFSERRAEILWKKYAIEGYSNIN